MGVLKAISINSQEMEVKKYQILQHLVVTREEQVWVLVIQKLQKRF